MVGRISIVMPTYNDGKFIRKSINSILEQSYIYFELIVVIDGSKDDTEDILREFKDSRIKVLKHKKNQGIGAALNTGFNIARGEYMTYMSSDCWVEHNWLEKLVEALDRYQEVDFVYSDCDWKNDERESEPMLRGRKFDREKLIEECYIGISYMFRKRLKDKVGDFDLRPCEDYNMFLRMSEHTNFKHIPYMLATWRNHPDNLTNRHSNPEGWPDNERIVKEHKERIARPKIKVVDKKPEPKPKLKSDNGIYVMHNEFTGKEDVIKRQHKPTIKVAHIHPWWDSASVGVLYAKWMNRNTDVEIRHIYGGRTELRHDEDLFINDDDAEIENVLNEADILHFNTYLWDMDKRYYAKPTYFNFVPFLKKKKVIYHIHGNELCLEPKRIKDLKSSGMHFITCSPIMTRMYDYIDWIPNIIPIDDKLYQPEERKNKILNFLFSVIYTHNKGKDVVDFTFKWLERYGYKFNYESWLLKYKIEDCLKERKKFDVVVDTLTQGFIGMVGWESMCHAQAVLARLLPVTEKAYTSLGKGHRPPIINCDCMESLALNAIDLIEDKAKCKKIGEEGRAWMEEYYYPEKIGNMYRDYYNKILKDKQFFTVRESENSIIKEKWNKLMSNGYKQFTGYCHWLIAPDVLDKIDLTGKSVLEVGCGYGRETKYFVEKADSVTGVDISGIILEKARELVPDAKFIEIDGYTLPFTDETVDFVYNCWVLQHQSKEGMVRLLKEMYRVCKGSMLVEFLGGIHVLGEGKNNTVCDEAPYQNGVTLEEITGILEEAGCKWDWVESVNMDKYENGCINHWVYISKERRVDEDNSVHTDVQRDEQGEPAPMPEQLQEVG